jgi:UDP-glucose 4-epimerase
MLGGAADNPKPMMLLTVPIGVTSMSEKRILVTGGAGFVGSHLTRVLIERGDRVRVFDNFFTGRREYLSPLRGDLDVLVGELRHPGEVSEAVNSFRPQVIFHLAALHYVPYCNDHPVQTVNVNVAGTEALLQACENIELEKFVFASSAAVYAISDEANKEDSAVAPTDIYGNTKYFGERLVRTFQVRTGTTCSVARLSNIYGPHETNPHVLPAILDQISKQTQYLELGNLEPRRDYVYVEDVVEALVALEERTSGLGFETYNVGTGSEYSVRDLVNSISSEIGRPLPIRQSSTRQRKSDRPHLLADISKIRRATGWKPRNDLRSGLRRLLESELPDLRRTG